MQGAVFDVSVDGKVDVDVDVDVGVNVDLDVDLDIGTEIEIDDCKLPSQEKSTSGGPEGR